MVEVIGALDDGDVTVSIGVASGATSAALATWHAADSAMYFAKRAGGNQAHLHAELVATEAAGPVTDRREVDHPLA
jgi:hypothetical protein